MKKFISQILFILLLSISISAQTAEPQPVLVDEFRDVNSEETAARLDNFLVELSRTPNAKGLIRIYSKNEICFLCRYREGSWISAYVKNTRRFPTEKYSIEYCDENREDLLTRLYLLPTASELPKCEETVEIPKISTLFDGTYFYFEDYNKVTPREDTEIDVVGPGNGEYSRNALNKIKDILDKSPESKIYIVVYLGTNLEQGYYDEKKGYIEKEIRKLDKKSLAKNLVKNAMKEFVKNGIKPSQIESMEGGYVDDKRKMEFWFIPKGGEIPKPKPDYFPKKMTK